MIAVAQELALIFCKKKSRKTFRKEERKGKERKGKERKGKEIKIVWKYSRKNKEDKSKKTVHLNSKKKYIYIYNFWPFLDFSLK